MATRTRAGFQALHAPTWRRDDDARAAVAGARTVAVPRRLLEWKEISPWRQNGSEHLQTGYRPEEASVRAAFGSWTYLHNDSVNIFSHIAGALLFVALPLQQLFGDGVPARYRTADVAVCAVYFAGVAVCFTFSTLFHTFMSHSEPRYLLGIKFDYQGILLLMWGSTVPLAYYGFPCEPAVHAAYWAATTVLAALCSVATFHPAIGGPHLGHVRAGLFGAFGLGSFVVPVAHGIRRYGLEVQSERVGLGWIGVTALCNAVGVVIYALKFPEKYYPRRFDIWGASHQVMHVMVVLAALAYTKALLQMSKGRDGSDRCDLVD
ncbi:hemolysin-III channel protein-like protein Izh2 [Xylariomycetidae sp. FL0641]|nr:hemolysin-III channel protein-like protein Izh2 [Xylariomycetidae sp. FL0641]